MKKAVRHLRTHKKQRNENSDAETNETNMKLKPRRRGEQMETP
jgi:hypothetical protein